MKRLAGLVLLLLAGLALARFGERLPAALPANAPANVFSAERAMADVKIIAREPHPVGSAANARVRDHLLSRLLGMGLQPEVQRTAGVYAKRFTERRSISGATVENIVAVMPGRSRTAPALLLMAHYDSVPGSPGAADDAAGVASILEVARILQAQGTPARDVILLFTDGEESGLLGAEAFFRAHPLARRVGFVINLEARGGSGQASMFETGPGNGGVIDLFAHASPQPASNSLTVFVYQNMPNDTDFSVPKAQAIAGLNYAFVGLQFDYHSPSSTPAALDRGSLQHMGREALGAARAAAFAETLPTKAPDKVYDTVFGLGVISYPPMIGWLIVLASAALIAAAVVRARRAGGLTWLDVLQGLGAGLYLLAFSACLQHLPGRAGGLGEDFVAARAVLARFGLFEAAVAVAGLAALLLTGAMLARGRSRLVMAALPLVAGLAGSLFGGFDPPGLIMGGVAALLALVVFGRPAGTAGAWAGLLILALLAGGLAQIFAPLAAFILTWPILAAALAAFATQLGERRGPIGWTVAAVLAVLVGGWLMQFGHLLLVGLNLGEGAALPLWLIALTLWPLVHHARAPRWAGAALFILALALPLILKFTSPWTERYPRAVYAVFHQDAATGKAWRVVGGDDPWSRQVLGGGGTPHVVSPRLWLADRAAPDTPIAQPPPTFEAARLPDGRVRLTVRPAPGSDNVSIDLTPTVALSEIAAAGVSTDAGLKAKDTLHLRWEATAEGVELTFKPAGAGGADLALASLIPGWPATARPLPPMPARTMGFYTSGSTLVTDKSRVSF